MPRIEIEMTSSRPDGSWTWRAAGARQPKGTLDGSILPAGVKVGEVLRADVDVDVDGMTVTAVVPPKTKRVDSSRIEVIGPPPGEDKSPDYAAQARASQEGRRPPTGGGGRTRDRDRDRDRAGGGPPGRDRDRPGRPSGPSHQHTPARGERPERPERARPPRERASRPTTPPPPKPRPKRLHAGRAHRDAVVASLPPEERPIAEQVLRGGVPAVRQGLEEQNAAARAAGGPEVPTDALVALAEEMLPRLRAAEWLDRAEAAVAQVDEVALRDLRALVAGADAAGREEAGRELAGRLRQALEERSTKERDVWLAEITEALDDGRIVRALRSSARPPDPGVKFPAPLAERLSAAASEALGPDVAPDRWAAVLEAVVTSPVRRTVQPRGLPAGAPPELLASARQMAPRIPGLAALVGAPASGPPRPGARGPGRPPGALRPPPPPRPQAAPVARPPEATPAATQEPIAEQPADPPAEQPAAEQPTAEPVPRDASADQPADDGPAPPASSGDDGDDAVLVEELG